MNDDGSFLSIAKPAHSEITIKKSRFLCTLAPTDTKERSDEIIAEIKKEHYNATHNCSAVIIGENRGYQHSSDDGEPQGTAGLPMLEVLRNNDLTDITAVVTRYFGGILLGAGGLVRAYSSSVAEAVKNAAITQNIPAVIYEFAIDYNGYSKLMNLAHAYDSLPQADFLDKVYARVVIEEQNSQEFEKTATQAFMGADVFRRSGITRIIKNKS